MALKKAGRPPEDRLMRKLEIYRAAAPLLQKSGAKGLSMRDAASAASLSVGGLYHYFPTKRDLVLFPLNPEIRARLCNEFHLAHDHLAKHDPQSYFAAFIDNAIGNIFLVRPAVLAAKSFDTKTLWSIFDEIINEVMAELLVAVKPIIPEATEHDLAEFGKALRRASFAAIVDSTVTPDVIRKEIRALVDGHRIALIREQKDTSASVDSSI